MFILKLGGVQAPLIFDRVTSWEPIRELSVSAATKLGQPGGAKSWEVVCISLIQSQLLDNLPCLKVFEPSDCVCACKFSGLQCRPAGQ